MAETKKFLPTSLTVAVASGKGGCGKTTTSVALANALAARGKSVMLVDGDVSAPNAHIVAGLQPEQMAFGVNEETKAIVLPTTTAGAKVLSPQSLKLAEPKAVVSLKDLTIVARFCEPVDIVIVDLPPGWTNEHSSLASTLPDAVITVVAPSTAAVSDHMKHVRQWKVDWKRAVQNREDEDRRRKVNLPAEPNFIVVETMGKLLGTLDGSTEPVTVRPWGALSAEKMERYASPAMSLPPAETLDQATELPEIASLVELIEAL